MFVLSFKDEYERQNVFFVTRSNGLGVIAALSMIKLPKKALRSC